MKPISPGRLIFAASLLLAGLALLGLAFLAYTLGIDHNPEWGKSRILMAAAGFFLILAAGGTAYPAKVRTGVNLASRRIQASRFSKWVQTSIQIISRRLHESARLRALSDWWGRLGLVRWLRQSENRKAGVSVALITAAGILAYLISASPGNPFHLPGQSNYYDMLADGFLHGQTSLLVQPDPALLAVANPYTLEGRGSVPYIWDITLYNGKFFLYWGPTPALVAAAWKLLQPGVVDDQYLGVFFLSGILVFSGLLIYLIRKQFFPGLSGWLVLPLLLAAAAANPVFFILQRTSVYEAAITGGQFFLMLGFLLAFLAISAGRVKSPLLLLAGISLALAVGSRITLAPAAAGLVVILGIYLFLNNRATAWKWVFLALPPLAGLAALGWYNFERFGSILESGTSYQLTGLALPSDPGQLISTGYILPNLYTLLFRPFVTIDTYPFVYAPWIKDTMWPWFIHVPKLYYYTEPVTGALAAFPMIWLALSAIVPLSLMLGRRLRRQPTPHPGQSAENRLPAPGSVFLLALTAAIVLEIAVLSVFIAATMRYELDFIPTTAILAAFMAFWWLSRLEQHRFFRGAVVVFLVIASLASAALGILLGLSG